MHTRKFGWAEKLGLAGAAITAAGALTLDVTAAQAAPSSAGMSATVVHVVTRAPIGKMLANDKGLSLYTAPGACTGSCLGIWPPLVMPKGATVPLGAKCLSPAAFGKSGRQVTYHGKRLYMFYMDSGSSVKGQNVGGFKAASVTSSCP